MLVGSVLERTNVNDKALTGWCAKKQKVDKNSVLVGKITSLKQIGLIACGTLQKNKKKMNLTCFTCLIVKV